MKEEIKKLEIEKSTLLERVKKIDNAINAFREVCAHAHVSGLDAMKYDGHDSHNDYYKCDICGCESK